jgi:hypothetical protein
VHARSMYVCVCVCVTGETHDTTEPDESQSARLLPASCLHHSTPSPDHGSGVPSSASRPGLLPSVTTSGHPSPWRLWGGGISAPGPPGTRKSGNRGGTAARAMAGA